MKSRIGQAARASRVSIVAAFVATCGFGVLAYAGCGSSETTPAPVNPGSETGGSGDNCNPTATNPVDYDNPPVKCGPAEAKAPACDKTDKVDTCPANECMYQTKQEGNVLNLRMGRIRLWAPDALLSLTSIAVDPNVNAKCANAGNESFTWLMQIDKGAKTIKTGGARVSADHKTFAFLDESVDASKVEAICPGFKGGGGKPAAPTVLNPVNSPITLEGDTFATPKFPTIINVPIFDGSTAIILPLADAYLKRVTLSAGGSCIGGWDKKFWCDGDTLGWTTGGALVAKITAEDADRVPVKSAGCQSLCAILVNDATKTADKVCKRGPDGKIPEIGDSCVGGEGCKNAFRLAASFAAYGVTISGTVTPPADAGGTDSGGTTDAGGGTDAAPPADAGGGG